MQGRCRRRDCPAARRRAAGCRRAAGAAASPDHPRHDSIAQLVAALERESERHAAVEQHGRGARIGAVRGEAVFGGPGAPGTLQRHAVAGSSPPRSMPLPARGSGGLCRAGDARRTIGAGLPFRVRAVDGQRAAWPPGGGGHGSGGRGPPGRARGSRSTSSRRDVVAPDRAHRDVRHGAQDRTSAGASRRRRSGAGSDGRLTTRRPATPADALRSTRSTWWQTLQCRPSS